MQVLLALPLLVSGAVDAGPLTSACPATGKIKIDGRLSEAAWGRTVVASEMHVLGTTEGAKRVTMFRMLYTADALILGVDCQAPAGQKPPRANAKAHDGPVYADESYELYLRPKVPGPYFHFAGSRINLNRNILIGDKIILPIS